MKFTQKLMIATLLGAFAASGAMAGTGAQTGIPDETSSAINFTGLVIDASQGCTLSVPGGAVDLGTVQVGAFSGDGHTPQFVDVPVTISACYGSTIKDITIADGEAESPSNLLKQSATKDAAQNVGIFIKAGEERVLVDGSAAGVSIGVTALGLAKDAMTGKSAHAHDLGLKAGITQMGGTPTAGHVKASMTVTVTYN